MLRNYLTTGIRNFNRHRSSMLISIAGLALGFSCVIFIVIFVRDELSYERWIPGSENVYRAEVSLSFPGATPIVTAAAPFALAETMKAEIPEVLDATPFHPAQLTLAVEGRKFLQEVIFVDPKFFEIVRIPLVAGNRIGVLASPESVVISRAMSLKLFGTENAVGRTVTLSGQYPQIVTGVMQDLPYNTQMQGEVFAPTTSRAIPLREDEKANWLTFTKHVYVQLVPNADLSRVEPKTQDIFGRHLDPNMLTSMHRRPDELIKVRLTPFQAAHLTTDRYSNPKLAGSYTTIYTFSAIAVLILVMACFNFTNLSTAQATTRAREVSMRKVLGANRAALGCQLLGESVAMALFSLGLSLLLVEIFLSGYQSIVGHPTNVYSWQFALTAIAIAFLTGLLSGLYPAFVLSSFRPAATLKSNVSPWVGSGRLRSGLVVIQFAISIGLGVAVMVVFVQMRYAKNLDLGFQYNNMVIINASAEQGMSDAARESFAQALRNRPAIEAVGESEAVPFEHRDSRGSVTIPGSPDTMFVRMTRISPEFPGTYRMHLLAGRLLARERGEDISALPGDTPIRNEARNVIVNESAARQFGYSTADAVGKGIKLGDAPRTIVGVLQDSLVRATEEAATPTVFYCNPVGLERISVRITDDRIGDALTAIDDVWRQFAPGVAIDRHLLSQDFEKLFLESKRQGVILSIFVGLAIFIACLGLFGLAAFSAQRRTKEIGMRRVLGASRAEIVRREVARFTILVLIACAGAWPISWYFLHKWLETFAYRIFLGPQYFALVSVIAVAIAWVTITAHVLQVARLSPVDALRYE